MESECRSISIVGPDPLVSKMMERTVHLGPLPCKRADCGSSFDARSRVDRICGVLVMLVRICLDFLEPDFTCEWRVAKRPSGLWLHAPVHIHDQGETAHHAGTKGRFSPDPFPPLTTSAHETITTPFA